jgi:hypothetical protein
MTPSAPLIARTGFGEVHTPAGEHARLLRDVTRRTAPVLALVDAHTWPHAELRTLTAFLSDAVLRQVSDEEARLYPNDPLGPPFAELSADHVRLHALTAQLEHVHAEPCPLPHLRTLVEELLSTLRRHLEDEQRVLAALPATDSEVPAGQLPPRRSLGPRRLSIPRGRDDG